MKKTLVTLALASLAASAFANTSFYSYKDDSSSANLYVNGYARQTFDYGTKNHNVKNTNVGDEVTHFKTAETKLRVELGGDFSDNADLTVGFKTRFEYFPRVNTSDRVAKKDGVTTNAKWKSSNKECGLDLKRAYGYVKSAKYGSLTVGKTVSLVDNKFGDDLEYLGTFSTAIEAKTNFPLVFNYSYTYAPVTVSAGFAKDYGNARHNHTHQYALQVNVMDPYGDNWQALYANTHYTQNTHKTKTSDSYELSVSNGSLVKDLTLTAAVSGEQEKHFSGANEHYYSKDARTSVGVKAAYVLNQYFKPYAGYAYIHQKSTKTEDVAKTVTNTHSFYVGATSNVWNYKTVGVDVFGEFGYNHSLNTHKNGTVETSKDSDAGKVLAAGVKFNF